MGSLMTEHTQQLYDTPNDVSAQSCTQYNVHKTLFIKLPDHLNFSHFRKARMTTQGQKR